MYFTNINIGQYIPTGSFIHRLDPRTKLFSLLLIVSAIFPSKNIIALGFWAAMLIIAVKISKISWRIVLRASRPVMFLIVFTLIFNMIAASWSKDFIQGIYTAIFTASRLFVLMMFAVLLPLTTAPLELADGLDALLSPFARFGFPAHESAMMIGMALRFIPLLIQETDKIIRAQLSRGAKLDQGNIFQKVKAFMPVLIPLFIIIFRRADEIAEAMEARGYEGGEGRTRRKPLTWKADDTAILLACIVIVFVSLNFENMRKIYFIAAALVIIGALCFVARGRIHRLLIRCGILPSMYDKKVKIFNAMPRDTGNIVFLGDSITDLVNFDEALPSYHIINRGISADTTSGVLKRLAEVISLRPRKLFVLIGTNDIGQGLFTEPIARNIRQIVMRVQEKSPETKIYLQGVFPTRRDESRPNSEIQALNQEIKAIAQELHCTFIDLYPLLLDDYGELAMQYTLDGLHLKEAGVTKWMAYLIPYLDE